MRTVLCLNPFENQVYFHTKIARPTSSLSSTSLNPFMNQVYFNWVWNIWIVSSMTLRLNPFESQVYFYSGPGKAARGAGLRQQNNINCYIWKEMFLYSSCEKMYKIKIVITS